MKDEISIDMNIALSLCVAMGNVFESASFKKIDLCDFAKVFLSSETFDQFFYDATIFSQSPYYVLELFSEEHPEPLKKRKYRENDIAYWFGFLFGWWHIYRGISGAEIARNYDIDWLWFAYEPLHTQDIDYAIDRIEEDFKIESQQSHESPEQAEDELER